MAEPESNSLRAARTIDSVLAGEERGTAPAIGREADVDLVAAAIERSKAMRDRIEGRLQGAPVAPAAGQRPDPALPDETPENAGEPRGRGVNPPAHRGASAIEATVRQVLERERLQREQDRARNRDPDKGGPSR